MIPPIGGIQAPEIMQGCPIYWRLCRSGDQDDAERLVGGSHAERGNQGNIR